MGLGCKYKYLQQLYNANFKIHIMDQILMTAMTELNLIQDDLSEHFAVSQGVVSKILPY